MIFTPVRKVSTYQLIVDQVEQGVTSGELRAGDRLPGERQLMETFSVSRATVREAMRVLQATGVVESRPGDPRGPVVMPYTSEMLERPLHRLASLEEISRTELLQFRLMLEGQAALLAAHRADADALDEVESCARAIGELDANADTAPAEFGRRVNLLHESIRTASGNQLIQACGTAVGEVLADLVRRRLEDDADRSQRMAQSAADASTLVALLRAGDAPGALRAAAANIYRYYRDSLTPEERDALEPMLALVDDQA